MTIAYAITQVNDYQAENALENFINREIADATPHMRNQAAAIYLFCRLDEAEYTGRRIIVVSDSGQEYVRVCIEASYELFAGDTHYHVKRIGTADRATGLQELPAVIRKAYAELIAWKPTHEFIWDNVY